MLFRQMTMHFRDIFLFTTNFPSILQMRLVCLISIFSSLLLFYYSFIYSFTGGAISNMYSIMAARYKYFPEVKTKGMAAVPKLVLFTSEQVSLICCQFLFY